MFTVEQSIRINRPVVEVFGYVTNPANIPRWRADVLGVNGADGSVAAGSQFEELVNFMGRKTYTMRVIEYQPHRRAVIQAIAGPGVSPTQTFEFEPSDGGTHVSVCAQVRTAGIFRLMEPMMPGMFKKMWGQYLVSLKQILEG
jgi:uncharacterized protein YndB with AHSA1/START domain